MAPSKGTISLTLDGQLTRMKECCDAVRKRSVAVTVILQLHAADEEHERKQKKVREER